MDSNRHDMATKERITVFQSHEVAHMWFVNLFVPMYMMFNFLPGSEILPQWNGGTTCI